MKISIRVSILSILLTLLLGTSFLIAGIDYFTTNDILIKTTKNSLHYASGKVSEQISSYLQPLERNSYVGSKLISANVVTPEQSINFNNFMYRILAQDTDTSAVYWGDETGNFYMLTYKTEDKHFISESITQTPRGNQKTEITYNENWNLIKTRTVPYTGLNPNIYPWYQRAKFEKEPIWLITPFTKIGGAEQPFGITATTPVYDENQKLRGVFAVDIPLEKITTFVKNIKVTENSIAFICDQDSNVISAYTANTNLMFSHKMPKLADLNIPIAQTSFELYKKNQQSIFSYNFKNEKYIAAYEKIPNTEGESDWQVAIVTPVKDITAPLEKNILLALFFSTLAVVLGIVLATIFSSHISKPIVTLADDAELICQLRLMEVKNIFSRIKEISLMANSFSKMKNAIASFQRYMPIALVKNLLLTNKIAEVGGEIRELTLLFSDIENFTSISENISAEDLMQYLSEYFQSATRVILQTGGTIDKYIGDGIMAFWGAPIADKDHALHACQAAWQLQQAFQKLNEKWQTENKPQLATRIGINTGPVVVGNVGSDDRLNYTSLGNTVNLASRLESLNKNYHTYIMVGESTYNLVKDSFIFRLLDKVTVKGKKQGSYVYELMDIKAKDETKKEIEQQNYNQLFSIAFNKYENGEWQAALDLFNQLAKQYPEDYLSKIFIERCTLFLKKPPQNWTGSWIMEEK